jgi:hypothetical protein
MLKRLVARLPITLATFLFSLFITFALTHAPATKDAPASDCAPRLIAPPPPANTPHTEPARAADKTPRISQQEIVNFSGVGRVRIKADETFGQNLRLIFENATSGKQLFEESFYGRDDSFKPDADYPELAPYARFRVMHVKGLPDPLIVGIAIWPGGSDCYWEAVAVGAVDGELKGLMPEHLNAADEGGFFFGDLGGGRGIGTVSWDFIWDFGYESHFDQHQYELKIYKWNQKRDRFEWDQVLRTRAKFDDGEKAVRSLGFNLRDVRKSFPDFKGELE